MEGYSKLLSVCKPAYFTKKHLDLAECTVVSLRNFYKKS